MQRLQLPNLKNARNKALLFLVIFHNEHNPAAR